MRLRITSGLVLIVTGLVLTLWYFTRSSFRTEFVSSEMAPTHLSMFLWRMDIFYLAIWMLGIICAVILGLSVSERLAGVLLTIQSGMRRVAAGDVDFRMHSRPGDSADLREFSSELNEMASSLGSRIQGLTDEKRMLETILSRTDDGMLVTDSESRITMLNPAAGRLLGISFENVKGKPVSEAALSNDLSELVARVLRTRIAGSLEISLTNQRPVYLNVYVAPLEHPGAIVGTIVVMHDLSSAKQIDSVRRDFIANLSHELRTPLASMRLMAETIILRGRKDPEAAERFAGRIISEADRLTALSDDLLDLSKIESGRNAMDYKAFPLGNLIEQVAAEYILVAAKKGIDLNTSISGDVLVQADKDSVVQILMNLIDNAVKYTSKGGKVQVSASQKGNDVVVMIADTGVGIPVDDLSRIFERFYRVDKARSRESGGTGLGLSIVRHLVEANSGKVTVESEHGHGSVFTFTLPSA